MGHNKIFRCGGTTAQVLIYINSPKVVVYLGQTLLTKMRIIFGVNVKLAPLLYCKKKCFSLVYTHLILNTLLSFSLSLSLSFYFYHKKIEAMNFMGEKEE